MKAQFGITETILIIGVLVASGITIYQLFSFYNVQTQIAKEEVVVIFAKDLEAIIDKAIATSGDVAFVYYPPLVRYYVKIESNTVFVHDKNLNKTASFSKQMPEIVSNYFEDSKKITIIKKENKIFIMGRCLENGEACYFSLACCSGFCWGSNGYTCNQNCAPNGEYAPDSLACCSKYLNSSRQCDNPPLCPAESVCLGSTDSGLWIDSQGRVCCPSDKPICSEKHCCPENKPKWCDNPKDGEARCMSEDEYEQSCQKETFILLFVQVNGNVPNFESLTEDAKNRWVAISPLSNCPQAVKKIVVSDKVCPVDECNALKDIKKCASDWGYSGSYTRVIGVKHGNYICESMGYTLLYDTAVVVVDQDLGDVMSHELGHTFGLCDEGYGNTPCSHCTSGICPCGLGLCVCGSSNCCPNKPELNSLMCSADSCSRGCSYSNRFASSSYSHLEVELDEFCQ